MIVDKDTKLYFSVSSKPGNFGSLLYNAAFKKQNINAIYKPLKCEKKDFPNFMTGLKYLEPSGLSVSMPFKKDVSKYCFKLSGPADALNVVNTVLYLGQSTIGHNTDYFGFRDSCINQLLKNEIMEADIYGDGGLANTIEYVLFKETPLKTTKIKRNDDWWIGEVSGKAYKRALINTTPIGMDGVEDNIFLGRDIKSYSFIFDCVVKKETNLIKLAKKLGIPYVNGVSMCIEQISRQYELYIGQKAPRDLFKKLLKENGYL